MDLAASPTTKHYRSRSGDALVSEAAARDSETVFALSTSASAATLAKHLLSADQVESGPPEGNCAAAMKDEHVGTASSSSATALPNDEAHRVLPRSPSVAAAAAVILAGQIRRDGSMASEDAPMNEDAQVRESIPPVDDSIHGLKKRGGEIASQNLLARLVMPPLDLARSHLRLCSVICWLRGGRRRGWDVSLHDGRPCHWKLLAARVRERPARSAALGVHSPSWGS